MCYAELGHIAAFGITNKPRLPCSHADYGREAGVPGRGF